eukprot:jgi/Undpi1/11894/HiC_scaffold_4.g01593.m1
MGTSRRPHTSSGASPASSDASTQHVPWNDGDDTQEEYASGDEDSALPRALARVFDWLEEVEGPNNSSGVDETIIDADALLALSAPSSPVRRDSDEVVIGTETELLRAWRCYSDFSSLAETAKALGAPAVTAYWDRLDQTIGATRTTDPARLRTEILADFVREPTTYVVVGVENNGRDTANSDDSDEGFATDLDGIASKTPPVRKTVSWGSDCCYQGWRTLGSETRHPMKRKWMEQPLKPEPQVWDGL